MNKTIEQCKDEVARKYEKEDYERYQDWYDIYGSCKDDIEFINKIIDEAMQLYADSQQIILPTDKEIKDWAYKYIPVDGESGCIENDIDYAKRRLLIEGATFFRSQIQQQIK